MNEYWFEDVQERLGPHVLRSTCRPATVAEVEECVRRHMEGDCPHTIVQDERGWLYDSRSCAVCGRSLGFV
jgi:hypothetical protein